MNQVRLQAVLTQAQPIRYTPAGVGILDVELAHRSEVVEAGYPRQLDFQIDARAVGEVAQQLATVAFGTVIEMTGFINTTRKQSSRVLLHILSFQCLGHIGSTVSE